MFSLPGSPRPSSTFDDTGELILKRDKLSEYFVQHCDSMLRAFDCNSECQALLRTVQGSSSVIFYITEYITSWSKETGRPEFRNLINAFLRKKSYNPLANAPSILLSLYNALCFGKEVDMTMLVETVMTDSSFIASHTFRPFFLNNFMADMLGQNRFQRLYPTVDDQDQVSFTPGINFATNYIYRPDELEQICPFDFARYEKFHANDFDRDSKKQGNFRFKTDHPQSMTHLLREMSNVLPSFHGRSFPFLGDLEIASEAPDVHEMEELRKEDADIQPERDEEEQMLSCVGKSIIYKRQERAGAYLLFTFLPMRQLKDIKHANERWWHAFHRHLPKLPKHRIDNIMNMYNDAPTQKRYKEQLAKERRETREDAKNEQDSTKNQDPVTLILDTDDAMFVHEGDIKTTTHEEEEPEQEELINDNFHVSLQNLLEAFEEQQRPQEQAMINLKNNFANFINQELVTLDLSVQRRATVTVSTKSSSDIEKLLTPNIHGHPLQLLEHAPSFSVSFQPKIQDILALAEHMGTPLKRNQIRAFQMLATAFLKTVGKRDDPLVIPQIWDAEEPLRMILTGKAGTGKSAVFRFLKIFVDAWLASPTSAPQPRPYLFGVEFGSAAALIGASTNAKIAGQKKTITPTRPIYITRGEHFQGVNIFIIDEFSLTSKPTFLALNRSCQHAKHDKSKFFPNMHLVLCGDVMQIPPPHNYGIFRVLDPGKENIQYSQGTDFVRNIRDVIVLDEVVRTDPNEGDLRDLQEAARYGTWTKRHLDIMNSRKLSESTRSQLCNIPLFIVGTNKEKAAINEDLLEWYRTVGKIQMFYWTNSADSVIPTLPQLKAKWAAIDRMLKLKGPQANIIVPPFTFMFVGMSVTLTKNTAPSLGCANHATGKVQGIFFPQDTTFTNEGPSVLRASKPPTYVDVELDFTPVETLPGYTGNVRPVTLTRQEGKISYTFENETFNEESYAYDGIPLLHTDATTVHGIQGLTISNRPICVHYPRKYFKSLPGVALYVILTRIKKLRDLFFAEEWTFKQLSTFRPEPYMLELWQTFEQKARLTEAAYFPDN